MTDTIGNPIFDDYGDPIDIVTDPDLSIAQKTDLLDSWALNEEALTEATAEGLDGGRRSRLREVQIARQALTDLEDKMAKKAAAARGNTLDATDGDKH